MASANSYWSAARHPWSCLLFVVPLLLVYEIGLRSLGPAPDSLRNGADAWLRMMLQRVGVAPAFGAPALVILILLVWSLIRRGDSPDDVLGTEIGILVESAFFALLLFGLCMLIFPLVQLLGGMLDNPTRRFMQVATQSQPEAVWEQIVRFVGAGIYEEMVFRLILLSAIFALLREGEFSDLWAIAIAATASSLIFAAAHHFGSQGEPFNPAVFLFRSVAGLYFAVLFYMRGFGVVVGAHAGYDVLVGLRLWMMW